MATLFQYRLQEIDTTKLGVTRVPRGSRTLADALARRPAPKAAGELTEFAAMKGIADLLERLNDESARSRVLQWVDSVYRQAQSVPAAEPAPTMAAAASLASTPAVAPAPIPTPTLAFQTPDAPATPALARAPADTLVPETNWDGGAKILSDSDLSVDDLEDWFVQPRETPFPSDQPARALFANEQPAPNAHAQPAPTAITASQSAPTPVGPMQSAQTPVANITPADAPTEAGTAQPVVSMIHDFVADFQKLARDWQES